ncbi:MAG: beta-lactamase family protein [Clostridiales bacterium]|nr:beta-lactamase family protein [Clostridiales bacterium]
MGGGVDLMAAEIELTAKLRKYAEDSVFYHDLPGLAAGGSVGASALEFQTAAGYRNMDAGEILKPGDVFHMASVTKLFTGTAIMMLIEEGKLGLADKIVEILGNMPIADKRCTKVTIEHLLTHTSGIFDGGSMLWEPGHRRFSYSDLGYELLGRAAEGIAGKPFDELIREKILIPLQMSNSDIRTGEQVDINNNTVYPHAKGRDKKIATAEQCRYNRQDGPSAALVSNLEDMSKWAKAHLCGKKLLKPETYGLVWGEYAPVPGSKDRICMTWFKRTQAGYELYGHEGADKGFRSGFWLCPELKIHVAVMSNIASAPIRRMCEEIFSMLLAIL